MNQKNFIICCFILLCCLFQPLYAAVNDKTICQVTWNKTDFNSVQNGKFVKSIRFGEVDFVEITISGQKDIQYKTTNNYVKYGHLDLGSEKKGEFWDTLYWAPKGSGYKIQMVEIASLMRAYAASEKVWVTWGKESEKTIYHNSLVSSEDPNSYTTSLSTTQFQATDTYMPFKLRRDASASQPFILAQLQLKAYVIPDAPSWKTSEANVKVTVNQSAASIHWYALKDYVQVSNAVFEPTLRCDADGENAPYLVWNTARDSFYVIKPGDYSLRAYVDKSDELYCSSAYSSSNLTVHATSDASEEADAELFFVVDGQIANQTNKTNHGWETYLFYESGNSHKVEYIYAYANPTITVDKRTEKGVHYTEDTDPYSDIFSVDDKRLKDTLQVTVNGTHTATLVLTIQQANHVPFTMNTTKKKDLLVVPTSLKDASWNAGTNRMEFAYKDLFEMNDERVFEVLFTGVPDSVVFGYGNNSDYSASSSKLMVAYATVGSSTYTPFDTITGKPSGTQFYNAALLPNVNRLRFTYKGVQKVGWITNLTVTERKELKVRTADDTIRFVARYNPDTTLYYDAEMDWYNLTPDLQYMSTSTTDGDLFGAKVEDIQVGWDQYGENQKLQFFYKPARVGRQTSDVLVYSADITPTADMPASKLLARRVLEALTGFGADDVNFTHQTDTVEVAMGADTANLFMVLDKAGRAIESDSIFITYDYDTTQLAVNAEGKITPLCIGYHKVVAHLQGNMIMPELSDSLYIYVPQTGKNTVTWTIPETVFKGDTLIGIASYADSVGITYGAIPETALSISGDTLVVKQAGLIQVVSYGDSSCYSRATTDTISIRVKGVMTAEFTDLNWNNMMLDDQLNNIIVVKNDQGDTINDQVDIQLQLLPAEVGRVVGQTVILDNSMDSVRIVATITHDTIRGVEISSPYFKVQPKSEKVTFENMEDTMLIGKTWNMLEHTTTRSGKQIDSIYVDPSASALIENFSLTPSGRGLVTIYAISSGTTNYPGPDTASYKTRFVQGVLPIEWEKNLSLESLHANDTLATSLVPVYDADTVDITSEVTKSYQLDPSDVAHVDEATGNIVIDQPAESLIIYVVTTGDNYQTRYDTIYCGVRTYEVDTLIYPNEPYRAGDVIAIADIQVVATNQEDLTDRVSLSFDFDDRTMAEVVGDSIVFNKSGLLDVYTTIEGTGVATMVDTTTLLIGKCQIGEIIYPEEPIEQYYEGDTILVNQIIVKNPAGRDVTRLATVEWTVTPQGSAHVDSLGNLIFDKPGAISIQMLVTGEHLEDSTLTFDYTIRHDETNCLDLLVQVWEDVLAVDNKTNDINTFVRYEWYKDEAVLTGESNQDYHAPQGEWLSGTYYVRAYDAQGAEYLLCEKTIRNQAPSAAMRQFVVYPSMVSNQESYVVETASNGEVTLTNSNGLLIERFAVEAGKTTVKSPVLQGVYMVHFMDAEGQKMMQKMIVK